MIPRQINPPKKKYRSYSPTQLTNAFQAVKEDDIAVRKAAKLYGIPLTTLRDRVDNRVSVDVTKSGPDPLLNQHEESKLVEHIKYMSDMGYGYTRSQVIELGSDFATHLHKREVDKPLSRFWYGSFMSRWPELRLSKPRSLSTIRAKSASSDTVQAYYTELEKILDKYHLTNSPQSIYNIDEKGICTEHKPPNIVSGKEISAQAITSPRGKNTTVIGCGNAVGQQIPPFYVFAGKRKINQLIEGAIPGTDFDVSDSGWSNMEIFESYLKEHFSKFVKARNDEYLLVLYDGHTSHVSLSLIEWAKENHIILFLLPPHCSHILQPLDIGCFGPFERIYNRECSSYLRKHPGQTINRLNVCQISSKAYSLALSPENLRSSFRRAGIYPFDRTAVPESKLKPAILFQTQQPTPCEPVIIDTEIQEQENAHEQTQPLLEQLYLAEPLPQEPTVAVNTHAKPTSVEDFFEPKALKINKKETATKKKSSKQLFSNIIGGHAITEEDVHEQIKTYKESYQMKSTTKDQSVEKENEPPVDTTKSKTGKSKGKALKPKRNRTVIKEESIPEPQAYRQILCTEPSTNQPGPSAYYIDSETDLDLSDSDTEGDCCVCHKHSPPGLRDCLDVVFVKWAQCQICDHWTHLRFCSSVRVVRKNTLFRCPHCEHIQDS